MTPMTSPCEWFPNIIIILPQSVHETSTASGGGRSKDETVKVSLPCIGYLMINPPYTGSMAAYTCWRPRLLTLNAHQQLCMLHTCAVITLSVTCGHMQENTIGIYKMFICEKVSANCLCRSLKPPNIPWWYKLYRPCDHPIMDIEAHTLWFDILTTQVF